ncbi:DUF4159 domain-containing protein [Oricola cellulosilytica]|uniref:DUF4159 domain-containing protein n=1 Tax=Oricola cellulosilytica TaxID=1429082 RepID=A0A4R0PCZ7_9HYPH|nr:DUF4159 domain-containing protein [Oricola cellulosilytica]TCD15352.1 DUF4159 domain-containing protein [Oricola cellulosilytica]
MFGLPVTFAAPALLFGLLSLPVIWWLLRLTPPKPRTELFPPLRLLAQVMKHEETPARSPWWLTALRLAMATLVILALARPVLNPAADVAVGGGPLALMIDNGWSTGRDWDVRMAQARQLIEEAGEAGRPVAVAFTVAPENASVTLAKAPDLLPAIAAALPLAAKPDRQAALARLQEALNGTAGATLAWLSDGLESEAHADTVSALNALSVDEVILFDDGVADIRAIRRIDNTPVSFEVDIVAPTDTRDDPVTVSAYDERGRLLADAAAESAPDAGEAIARFDVPFELRNDFAILRVASQPHAGAVWMVDENTRRRRIGLITGQAGDLDQPLLSPLYYIQRALQPYADLIEGRTGDLSVDIPALIARGPAMIAMADIGVLPEAASRALVEWVEEGGTLVRFAGPRMAATATSDPLLPVELRLGERTLGGSLSWTEPQPVAPFPDTGPFGGLEAPREVSVSRQVLAQPDLELVSRTWANLADGTPLVTGASRGEGTVVLFHVTAEATWSNLPISGSFVEMLRRIASLSRNSGAVQPGNGNAQAEALPPYRILAADGELGAPPSHVRPLDGAASREPANFVHPAGLYGTPDGFVARNVLTASDTLVGLDPAQLTASTTVWPYDHGAESDLRGPLFLIALLLLALDTLAVLWMNGRFGWLRPGRTAGAFAAILLVAAGGAFLPDRVQAQETGVRTSDVRPGDDRIIELLETTRIAYVTTGNSQTDEISASGLSGLSRFLQSRTALEPAEPVGLDLETDELAFYTLIYFPIDVSTQMPTEAAISRLDAFMQGGGTVLFDTRDQLTASFGGTGGSPENQRLRDILKGLNIPPLEPVPADHVLTKAFYILDRFPGRYDGSPLWVEALTGEDDPAGRPVRSGDGVTPILITGNDFAAAWALDASGRPMFPTVSSDPLQRIYAFRAGVNIMMYMLTGNYKSDQVHVPALLERLGQ